MNITRYIEVRSGRLHEVLRRFYSFAARDHSSWGRLFKTKAYCRRREHTDRLIEHAHWLVRRWARQQEGFRSWRIERKGSNNLLDVMAGTNQYYHIIEIQSDGEE